MKLKYMFGVLILGVASGLVLNAQFGGIKIPKLDRATDKAKPVTDRAEKVSDALTPWSAEEEEQIGAAAAAKMIHSFPLIDSPKINTYVNLVGSTVAQFAPRQVQYRFGVLNTDIVGAFALPGGFVFITRRALEGMKDESELAGALGHEIIHVSERHLESEIRASKTSAMAVEESKNIKTPGGANADAVRRKADALLSDLFNLKLSRDKEEGADQRGSMLAMQAGYAPGGLMNFLQTLQTISDRPESQRVLGQLLSTHPSFDDRLTALRPWVQKNSKAGKTLEQRFRTALE